MEAEAIIRPDQRRHLVVCAWGVTICVGLLFAPSFVIMFWLFPLGLLSLAGVPQPAKFSLCVGIWLLYLVLVLTALMAEKRKAFFTVYGVLCLLLSLNVLGAFLMMKDIEGGF